MILIKCLAQAINFIPVCGFAYMCLLVKYIAYGHFDHSATYLEDKPSSYWETYVYYHNISSHVYLNP